MKRLLSTTALALALGLPSAILAQSTPAPERATQSQSASMAGFLSQRDQSDLFASELMGHDVHARRVSADASAARTGAMATVSRADLDEMDNIGQINEIVLSHDGQVRAIVIGVGGFLGMGERDVAVTMDQVTFASDPEDRAQMHVIVNVAAEMLEGSPAYDRSSMIDGGPMDRTGAATTNRTSLDRPEMTRDGYNLVDATRVTTEMLVGATVYDPSDTSVGTVEKLVLDADGAITNLIIDFGGFLGIGSHQVSVRFDDLTIFSNDRATDMRIYVDATKKQIEALPQYQAMN
ncbi:PRC-barrel domain-containing protein [Rhodovulum tesquicola]|uniref:PRC-barrel domain-containing protein n=1 Tax=Rhodovulum tesquicola TaxID=540254 RepID=UPI002096E6B3|nr:PRC-barrel domain-containing protein [Rhodovulum tesquicola]MCO8146647.1 PRC-barrel domain-containing protein [Rhodovulum tesquicola]